MEVQSVAVYLGVFNLLHVSQVLLSSCPIRLQQLQREREELEQQKERLKAQQEELRRTMGQVGEGWSGRVF